MAFQHGPRCFHVRATAPIAKVNDRTENEAGTSGGGFMVERDAVFQGYNVIVANNTYTERDHLHGPTQGRLAEWDGERWTILETCQFNAVTGRTSIDDAIYATARILEILALPLDAELVVLSACDTGRGKLERGDVALEESIALYERGAALKKRCETKLKEAEEKVAQFFSKNTKALVSVAKYCLDKAVELKK